MPHQGRKDANIGVAVGIERDAEQSMLLPPAISARGKRSIVLLT